MKQHFKTWELVPWRIWQMLGENARNLVSGRLIQAMNQMRVDLDKPMICNTKGDDGRDQCCLRIPGQTHYRATSRHAGNHGNKTDGERCLASDTIGQWDAREAHAIILKNKERYHMVKFLEVDITWLHMDVREGDELRMWSPKRGFVTEEQYIAELKEAGFW